MLGIQPYRILKTGPSTLTGGLLVSIPMVLYLKKIAKKKILYKNSCHIKLKAKIIMGEHYER